MKKTIVLFVLFASNICCGANFGFIGAGSRASGMGGAFIGVADDATAIFWNPAGLTHLIRQEISIIGRMESSKFNYPDIISDYTPDPYTSFSLNFLSFAHPFKVGKRNAVLAASISSAYDFDFNTKMENLTISGFTVIDNSTGKMFQFTLGFAIDIIPRVSLGASIFSHFGERIVNEVESNTSNVISRGFNEKDTFANGYGLTFGTFINLSKKFHIGAVYKLTVTDLKVDSSWDEFYNSTYYSSNSSKKSNASNDYLMPPSLGIGISWTPSDIVLFSADFNIIKWSDFKINGDTPKHSNGLIKFTDSPQLHLGAEIFIRKGLFNNYPTPIRFGIYTDPAPLQDSFGNGTSGTFYTFGTGLITNTGEISISFEIGTRDYQSGTARIIENIVRGTVSLVFRI